MKKIFVLLFFFINLGAMVAYAGEPIKGFRDLKWGDRLTGDFIIKENDGIIITAERPHDNKKIGTVRVDDIRYQFFKNQFCAVEITFRDTGGNMIELSSGLEYKYGKPENNDAFYKNWHDKDDNYVSIISGDPKKGYGLITIWNGKYTDMSDELIKRKTANGF